MKIWKYKNYDEYVDIQIKYNKQKVGRLVFVNEKIIEIIADKHSSFVKSSVKNILCHGTRSGEEQQYFKKYFEGVDVLGTEISDNATQFPMTIQQDFNKVNEKLIGKYDIIYTNSFDHTYTPKETLMVWRDQLTEDGLIYIDWSDAQNNLGICESDPLNAKSDEIQKLASEIGMENKAFIPHTPRHSLIVLGKGKA